MFRKSYCAKFDIYVFIPITVVDTYGDGLLVPMGSFAQ